MITKEDAISAQYKQEFYTWFNGRVQRARVNGQCKVWKTRPEKFRLPMKYGLKQCFYLEPFNADVWFRTPGEVVDAHLEGRI